MSSDILMKNISIYGAFKMQLRFYKQKINYRYLLELDMKEGKEKSTKGRRWHKKLDINKEKRQEDHLLWSSQMCLTKYNIIFFFVLWYALLQLSYLIASVYFTDSSETPRDSLVRNEDLHTWNSFHHFFIVWYWYF